MRRSTTSTLTLWGSTLAGARKASASARRTLASEPSDPAASPWHTSHHPNVRPCPCSCHDAGVVDDVRVNPDYWKGPLSDPDGRLVGWLDGCAHVGCCEALALQGDAVDLESGSAAIRHTLLRGGTLAEPKTERSRRVVDLPRFVVDALRRHKATQARQRLAAGPRWRDGGFVFTQPDGKPLSADMARDGYYRVVEAAGLHRLPFHHLRHAFATLQLEAGEDIASVSRMLGHASLATTADTYAHLTRATQRRAADRMDAILTG